MDRKTAVEIQDDLADAITAMTEIQADRTLPPETNLKAAGAIISLYRAELALNDIAHPQGAEIITLVAS